MIPNEILDETAWALRAEWNLRGTDLVSEEALLKLLAERIAEIIAMGPDAFYQLMYRIDISEKKLTKVVGGENVPEAIARLVYTRQLEKIESRHKNKQKDDEPIDPDLKW